MELNELEKIEVRNRIEKDEYISKLLKIKQELVEQCKKLSLDLTLMKDQFKNIEIENLLNKNMLDKNISYPYELYIEKINNAKKLKDRVVKLRKAKEYKIREYNILTNKIIELNREIKARKEELVNIVIDINNGNKTKIIFP